MRYMMCNVKSILTHGMSIQCSIYDYMYDISKTHAHTDEAARTKDDNRLGHGLSFGNFALTAGSSNAWSAALPPTLNLNSASARACLLWGRMRTRGRPPKHDSKVVNERVSRGRPVPTHVLTAPSAAPSDPLLYLCLREAWTHWPPKPQLRRARQTLLESHTKKGNYAIPCTHVDKYRCNLHRAMRRS